MGNKTPVAAAVVRRNKILLVKRGEGSDFWDLPQGMARAQTDIDFLRAKVFEWTGFLLSDDFHYLGEFGRNGKEYGVFLMYPEKQVGELFRATWRTEWAGYDEIQKYQISNFTRSVFDRAREKNKI